MCLVLSQSWALDNRRKSIVFHSFTVQWKFVLPIPAVRALLFFETTFFWFRFSWTLRFLFQPVMKPSEQVASSRLQVWYDVLLDLRDQGVYSTSIEALLTWRWTRRVMWDICQKGDLCVASLALSVRSSRFGLRCGRNFAIVCFCNFAAYCSDIWMKLNWEISGNTISCRGPDWGKVLIDKVDSVSSVWSSFA